MSSFLGAELQIIENMATKSKGIEHLEPVKSQRIFKAYKFEFWRVTDYGFKILYRFI